MFCRHLIFISGAFRQGDGLGQCGPIAGQHALQQNQPGQARLAFERGVQYLRKQTEPALYAEQLQYMEKLLARANSMVLSKNEAAPDDANELTEGLKTDAADDWKKKVIYD